MARNEMAQAEATIAQQVTYKYKDKQ